jgi:hypothetical protein
MMISLIPKFRLVPKTLKPILTLGLLFVCQQLWAVQEAVVVRDQAIIYSDEQMSSSIGYVKKGKRVKIGEKTRNLGQVYPILVSGKLAYIRALDVSTEKESMDADRFVSERFQKAAQSEYKSNYSLGVFQYSSQIKLDEDEKHMGSHDSFTWTGVSLKGGVLVNKSWDVDFFVNYLTASSGDVTFKALETGLGAALKVYQGKRLGVKLLGQVLAVPFASYAVSSDFRINGYGLTTGGGLSLTYLLGQHWGLEGFGGFYYTKLTGFDAPKTYESIAPSFVGSRLGLGLNYQF